jgi:hypothetical protein
MRRRHHLIAMAVGEGSTGLALLVRPSMVLTLLLGVEQAAPETLFFAYIFGAALLAFAAACWAGRNDKDRTAQNGLFVSVLIYDVLASGVLAYTALGLHLGGILLWPAVVLHGALAVWCLLCLSAS